MFADSALPAGLKADAIGALRKLYATGVEAIGTEAELMKSRGAPAREIADWANATRNNLKKEIRERGPKLLKLWAEQRNIAKYGKIAANPKLGPTADEFRAIGRSNEEIIKGAAKGSSAISKGAAVLRIAGRITIVLDITIAAINVAKAPEVDRPGVLLEETGGMALCIVGGEAGAEVGFFFWGYGAIPGAIIGCGLGSWGGRKLGRLVASELYPPAQTGFEGVPW